MFVAGLPDCWDCLTLGAASESLLPAFGRVVCSVLGLNSNSLFTDPQSVGCLLCWIYHCGYGGSSLHDCFAPTRAWTATACPRALDGGSRLIWLGLLDQLLIAGMKVGLTH